MYRWKFEVAKKQKPVSAFDANCLSTINYSTQRHSYEGRWRQREPLSTSRNRSHDFLRQFPYSETSPHRWTFTFRYCWFFPLFEYRQDGRLEESLQSGTKSQSGSMDRSKSRWNRPQLCHWTETPRLNVIEGAAYNRYTYYFWWDWHLFDTF